MQTDSSHTLTDERFIEVLYQFYTAPSVPNVCIDILEFSNRETKLLTLLNNATLLIPFGQFNSDELNELRDLFQLRRPEDERFWDMYELELVDKVQMLQKEMRLSERGGIIGPETARMLLVSLDEFRILKGIKKITPGSICNGDLVLAKRKQAEHVFIELLKIDPASKYALEAALLKSKDGKNVNRVDPTFLEITLVLQMHLGIDSEGELHFGKSIQRCDQLIPTGEWNAPLERAVRLFLNRTTSNKNRYVTTLSQYRLDTQGRWNRGHVEKDLWS